MPTGSAAAGMTPSAGAKHQQPPPSLCCLLLARSLPRFTSAASAAATALLGAAAAGAAPSAWPRRAQLRLRGVAASALPTPPAAARVSLSFTFWCAERERSLRLGLRSEEGRQRFL